MKATASSSKKIIVSMDRASWESIGIKAGWIKSAQAPAAPPKTKPSTTPTKTPSPSKPERQNPFKIDPNKLPKIMPQPKAKRELSDEQSS